MLWPRLQKGGYEEIMRLCHEEWGTPNVQRAMVEAAGGGHEAIVRLCHDKWGAFNVNSVMAKAAEGGHEAIVRLCHDEWGANDVDFAMAKSCVIWPRDYYTVVQRAGCSQCEYDYV